MNPFKIEIPEADWRDLRHRLSHMINSANTLYKAGPAEGLGRLRPGEKVTVPTGYAEYPMDTLRSWAERSYNVVEFEVMPRGGHFAAMEEPELFAGNVRNFFRKFR